MNRKPILLIPACEPGRGGGHITRCMNLARELRARKRDAFLCVASNEKTKHLLQTALFSPAWVIEKNAPDINRDWECVIFDRYQTPLEEFSRWKNSAALLIGIDEGGPCRASFDFLIDILPGVKRNNSSVSGYVPNIADPSLLPLPPLPEKKERPASSPLKVLVSFGQEDSAGLGPAVANALAAQNKNGLLDITLLTGAGAISSNKNNTRSEAPPAVSLAIIETIPNLAEHLSDYDLLVTHYGITAFEALYASTPVMLLAPGAYHEKLAQAAGFYSLGRGKRKAQKLRRLLFARNNLNDSFLRKLAMRCTALAARHKLSHQPEKNLADVIDRCAPVVSRVCTVCGAPYQGNVIARFHERTYLRCPACGIIGMNRLEPEPMEYGREYFFELYKKQYGKTYLDDFPNLVQMAARRLAHIAKLRAGKKGRVLDIGCAYGPFLAAAREAGFSPFGVDPAEDAVRYVQDNFGVPALRGVFPGCDINEFAVHEDGAILFDVVTLWYVIEHFGNCAAALAEIKKILKPGGILAFSTPSFSGVSGRSSLKRFLESSPSDHLTIWSPRTCKKALARAGFIVKKIVSTGHHPERFPLLGRFAASKHSPLYTILAALSKIFSLGDTFEVYALRLEMPHLQ